VGLTPEELRARDEIMQVGSGVSVSSG